MKIASSTKIKSGFAMNFEFLIWLEINNSAKIDFRQNQNSAMISDSTRN